MPFDCYLCCSAGTLIVTCLIHTTVTLLGVAIDVRYAHARCTLAGSCERYAFAFAQIDYVYPELRYARCTARG